MEPLDKIFILTPVPTVVLDSSLRIAQVSDSHLTYSELNRADIIGTSIFEIPLSKIPAPSLPVLLGALHIAISTKTVQVVDGLPGSPSLTLTPIFSTSSFIHLVIEAQVELPSAHTMDIIGGDLVLNQDLIPKSKAMNRNLTETRVNPATPQDGHWTDQLPRKM